MSHVIITGAQGGNTQGAAAPNRLEINTLIRDQKQFSLYIQALRAMYATPQTNSISHFQIAGIHGLPYVQWDGAGGTRPVQGARWGGYCTHGSVLFPTWHRPYIALYEQVIQQHALEIAKTYRTDQQQWLSAAQNLRAPYWDWASNSVPPPEVISLQNVNIITPDGRTSSVPNPLYQYTFNPVDPSFPSPWRSWRTTIRHPDDPRSPNATTDSQDLRLDLQSIQDDITESTYRLLTRVHTWPAFSNHTPGDGGSSSNSLEAIHDEIHGMIGGQMGYPQVAAFDPIFWLHHCNVDRMLSLWSAVNPGVWVTRGPADDGTFTIPATASIDANTPLTPFWNSQTGYWASSGTTTTAGLHYSYPEFNGLNLGDRQGVQRAISTWISQHYGGGQFSLTSSAVPAVSLLAQPPSADSAPAPAPAAQGHEQSTLAAVSSTVKSAAADVAHQVQGHGAQSAFAAVSSTIKHAASDIVHQVQGHGSHPHPPHQGQHPTVIYDWAVRIHAKKYELGHGYMVLIFLGDVPDDSSQWRCAPSFVGAHVSFVNTDAEQCDNCREQADLEVEGFVHLNTAIAKRSGLSSYEPSAVAPYLKDNLHWRVQAVDRSVVALDKLTSLEVAAVSNTLTHEPGAVFPIAGDPEYHNRVTRGRAGGVAAAQT